MVSGVAQCHRSVVSPSALRRVVRVTRCSSSVTTVVVVEVMLLIFTLSAHRAPAAYLVMPNAHCAHPLRYHRSGVSPERSASRVCAMRRPSSVVGGMVVNVVILTGLALTVTLSAHHT